MPDESIWGDRVKPKSAQDEAAEKFAGTAVPTRQDHAGDQVTLSRERRDLENGALQARLRGEMMLMK